MVAIPIATGMLNGPSGMNAAATVTMSRTIRTMMITVYVDIGTWNSACGSWFEDACLSTRWAPVAAAFVTSLIGLIPFRSVPVPFGGRVPSMRHAGQHLEVPVHQVQQGV